WAARSSTGSRGGRLPSPAGSVLRWQPPTPWDRAATRRSKHWHWPRRLRGACCPKTTSPTVTTGCSETPRPPQRPPPTERTRDCAHRLPSWPDLPDAPSEKARCPTPQELPTYYPVCTRNSPVPHHYRP